MKIESACCYIKALHPYAYRAGKTARIVSVVWMVPPGGQEARACFEVVYPDWKVDYVPVKCVELGHYSILGVNDED